MADIKQIIVGTTPYNIEPYTAYLPLAGGNMTGIGGIQYPTDNSATKSKHFISAGSGYSVNSGKYGVKILACDQSDCQSGLGQDCGNSSTYKDANGVATVNYPYDFWVIGGNNPSKTQGYISFGFHTVNEKDYKRVGMFDFGGNFHVAGDIYKGGQSITDSFASKTYVDNKVNTEVTNLIDGAPEALNTLKEISAALNNDKDLYTTLNNAITSVNTAVTNEKTRAEAAEKTLGEKIGKNTSAITVNANSFKTSIVGLSVNGRVITYTKGDGTTGTITTQDTNDNTYLFRLDTRYLNKGPYDTDNYPGRVTWHLKTNSAIDITGQDAYSGLLQLTPWADKSGGSSHQLAFGTKGAIYHRYGTDSWSNWSALAHEGWVSSNYATLTSHNSLATSVSTNTTDISNLKTTVSGHTTSISTNATNIAANTTAISNEKSRAEGAESGLSARITTNSGNIEAHGTRLTGAETNIAANTTEINAVKKDLSDNYLPLAGGRMSGDLKMTENSTTILMRSADAAWYSGLYANSSGDEVLGIVAKNTRTHIMLGTADPTARPACTSLTPAIDIKNGKVGINKRIGTDSSVDAGNYELDVNGRINASGDVSFGRNLSVAGNLNVTKQIKTWYPLYAYSYDGGSDAGKNRAAVIWDKPGSHNSGVGAYNAESDVIYFGPCAADGSWVADYKQKWKFQGNIYCGALESTGIKEGGTALSSKYGALETVTTNTSNITTLQGYFTGGVANEAAKTSKAVTFNNKGSGASSGTTFDGSTARTISYNTIGALGYTANIATSKTYFIGKHTVASDCSTYYNSSAYFTQTNVHFNGLSVFAGSFYATSDKRLKENIKDADTDYYDFISNIRLVKYNWKDDEDKIVQHGVIAQELKETAPEDLKDHLVSGVETDTDYLAVNDSKMVYIALGALQQQLKINQQLESRIARLEKLLGV